MPATPELDLQEVTQHHGNESAPAIMAPENRHSHPDSTHHDQPLASTSPSYINQSSMDVDPWSIHNLRAGRVPDHTHITELAEIATMDPQKSTPASTRTHSSPGTMDTLVHNNSSRHSYISHHDLTSAHEPRSSIFSASSTSSQWTSNLGPDTKSLQTTTSSIYTPHSDQEVSEQFWDDYQDDFEMTTLGSSTSVTSELEPREDPEDVAGFAVHAAYFVMLAGAQFEDPDA